MIFILHTVASKLAEELRIKEEKLKEITRERMKIVERSRMKLEDLISGKDPWRGGDCKRLNEIRCLSCEDKEKTRILESEIGYREKKAD